MKLFNLILFSSVALIVGACGTSKLDKIEFVDEFGYVQKNIIEFDSLLIDSNRKCKASYSFEFMEKKYCDRELAKR